MCGSHRLTYKEFWERVNRLANGLASLGIGLGKRVAVLLSNGHRFAELYLAVPQLDGENQSLGGRCDGRVLEDGSGDPAIFERRMVVQRRRAIRPCRFLGDILRCGNFPWG
ncbi:MAG: AMP-binding protein, partial [Thermodesulfobacteriota bacterium]